MKNITIEFSNNDTIEEAKEKLKSITDTCKDVYFSDNFIVIASVLENCEGEEYIICNIFKNLIEADSMIRVIGEDQNNFTTLSYFDLQSILFKIIAIKLQGKTEYVYENKYCIFDLKSAIIDRIADQLTNLYSSVDINC